MKRIVFIFTLLTLHIATIMAQDIQITRFERNYTSLIASVHSEYDNTGEACAVIRFFVRDTDFIIEANLGVVKREELPGEIRLYVPKGTKRLTVRHQHQMPLSGYEIPVQIEPKVTYDATLTIVEKTVISKQANQGHNVYGALGYNITSLSGVSLGLGVNINRHNIELGAVYGLNKTDDLFFYDNSSDLKAAYHYQAVRIQLRYGYDFKMTDFFGLMPETGLTLQLLNGSEAVSSGQMDSDYKSASSMSVFGAVKFVVSFSDQFKLHITPEYDFGIYKDNKCKWIADTDDTFKSWTDGFNLNIGLMYFF